MLIFAAVLGVQAGQRQLEMQLRQQVSIAIQEGYDARVAGQREQAIEAYRRALQLDPTNNIARDGLELVLSSIATPAAPVLASNTIVTVPASVATPAVVQSPTPPTDAAALWQAAQAARSAGRWPEALKQLLALKQVDPAYQPQLVTDLLFETYVNLASDQDNENNLEEALNLFDQALALRPDPAIQQERDLITRYLDATNTYGEAAITPLQQLYAEEPDYRDVAERLQQSYVTYGDTLVAQNQWCVAVEQFSAAAEIAITPGLIAKRDENQQRCVVGGGITQTLTPAATRSGETKLAEATSSSPTPTEPVVSTLAFDGRGHLLYSARDLSSGVNQVYLSTIGDSSPPRILREEAAQPAFRPDGQRLVFRNLRSDSLGLGAVDPATGLALQFTRFSEDSQPSWSPQGNKIVFASNREGDRLWRIYVTWAETDAEVNNLSFGETPHWHPLLDQIVFKGCDTTGNNCGLWSMTSTGSQRAPLTTVQRDTHPNWSPDGNSVVFMSDGRDGNMEIYLLQVSSGETVRLTNNPAADVLPTVSPDGQWVAFVSNRDGAWKFWTVPIDGGAATVLAPLNGDLGNWQDQGLVWIR